MKKFFLIFGISILFLFFWIGKSYNNLVKLNEEVKVQWAQVENSFQRRADLIPNLVNIVKGVSNFEKNTLIKIVEARSKATSLNIDANILKQEQIDNFQKIQNNLSNKLSRLLISIEKYPN
jgi:LemA protein